MSVHQPKPNNMPTQPALLQRVLLISMPFGPLFQPAIGLTSLKGVLRNEGISAGILYHTITFAEHIGADAYTQIVTGNPYVDLAGEWIFSEYLFEGQNPRHADYVDDVLRRKSPLNNRQSPVPEDYIEMLFWVKSRVDRFIDQALSLSLRYHAKIIGFTSTFQQHVASLCLAKHLKAARPDVYIVMGGGNCESLMGVETVRQFPFVDAVVSGEGEIIFPQLVRRMLNDENFDTLQGVFTQNNVDFVNVNGKTLGAPPVYEMDALPVPNYDDFFSQLKGSRLPASRNTRILFETSRGCWWGERHHCTFCGLNGETMAYRSKSAQRALDELMHLTQRYANYPVWVVDNILDMKYFNEFVPRLGQIGQELELFYEVKANLRRDQLQALREAGIKHLQPGIESLSNHVLELMKKGVSWLQNVQILKWCRELGIEVYWNIIWGFPGETAEDYLEMADLIPLVYHLQPPVGSAQIRLDRFSPNFNEAEAYGFINVRPAIPYQYIYPFEDGALANLAYHFFYDYEQPREVREYTEPLMKKVRHWRTLYQNCDVLMLDIEAQVLLLWDTRPDAPQGLWTLAGIERAVYLACDQIRTKHQLQKQFAAWSWAELSAMLESWVEGQIMAQDSQAYMGLAVRPGYYQPSLAVLQKIVEHAHHQENVIFDDTWDIFDSETEFGPQFFGVVFDEADQPRPVMYHTALASFIDRKILSELTEHQRQTIAGITIDM